MMRIIVQKFGGSSVADAAGRECACSKIRGALAEGLTPVVVISAMGRRPNPYATDSLLDLIGCYGDCTDLREREILMACGENISAVVMAHYLRSAGLRARAFTGPQAGIVTDDHYSNALILVVDPKELLKSMESGELPVVTGFQGVNRSGEITTLGRGGSDTTAVALGAALKAEKIEIYTDVDGIMTIDPRIWPDSRVVPRLTYEEVAAMSNEGAKVLHNRSVDLAREHGVKVVVRNTFSEAPGSCVSDEIPRDAFEKSRVVTSVAVIKDVTHIAVDLASFENRSKARLDLFQAMAACGISLDLINISGTKLFFIVQDEHAQRTTALIEDRGMRCEAKRSCAKVSCVGIGMKGTPGVMARIQEAFCEAGVEILHSTDSHITICCLIKRDDIDAAVKAVHDKFNL
jgi:aspartate kinase